MTTEQSEDGSAQRLRQKAFETLDQSRDIMAAALALERGELTSDEAKKLVECDDPIKSGVYPGDDIYDEADAELNGRMYA